MQDQPSFTVLDSFLMLICVYLLAFFPPGFFAGGQSAAVGQSSAEEMKDEQDRGQRSDTETKAPSPAAEV